MYTVKDLAIAFGTFNAAKTAVEREKTGENLRAVIRGENLPAPELFDDENKRGGLFFV